STGVLFSGILLDRLLLIDMDLAIAALRPEIDHQTKITKRHEGRNQRGVDERHLAAIDRRFVHRRSINRRVRFALRLPPLIERRDLSIFDSHLIESLDGLIEFFPRTAW